MNREILFKAKRKDTKEWVYGQLIYKNCLRDNGMIEHLYRDWTETSAYIYEDNCENNIEEYPTKFVEVIPKTISQYTGLKDKVGAKIFEGDILRDYGNEIEDWIVSYEYGKFVGNYDNVCEDLWEIHDFEVIGNKFDDGELIC